MENASANVETTTINKSKKTKKVSESIYQKKFSEVTKEELAQLERCIVDVQKIGKGEKVFYRVSVPFSNEFTKVITSNKFQVIDGNWYSRLLRKRKLLVDGNGNEVVDTGYHRVPCVIRFYKGLKKDGVTDYHRFEIKVASDMYLSEIFNFNDVDCINTFELDFNYHEEYNKKISNNFEDLIDNIDFEGLI